MFLTHLYTRWPAAGPCWRGPTSRPGRSGGGGSDQREKVRSPAYLPTETYVVDGRALLDAQVAPAAEQLAVAGYEGRADLRAPEVSSVFSSAVRRIW